MVRSIYVPLDNSEHSDAATTVALALAECFSARCVGMHVYAGRMHDYRFKQMEYTLPEEYQDEAELLRQRRIHDSLITTGLQLISDSYTDVMRYRCLERGIEFEARMRDGRNWEELVADINDHDYDLVVMGALGTGAVKQSRLGSVVDRVVRRIRTDTLVVRKTGAATMQGDIVVAVDGSPQSFGGLRTALEIGRVLHKRVEAVAVYDPYLHYAVFNGIVDVLSEKASKVFRFKEQEALHEEIIDTGLAKIYESHLRVAQATAAEEGVELGITLLDGKAFERVLRHVSERDPWLLVCGRVGVHSPEGMDIGSNTDQLLRMAQCDVLVSSATYVPPIDVRAEASVVWTPEAEERMAHVPAGARGLARTAVLRWCTERGHSVVSSGDVDAALDELMPHRRVMRRVAEVDATLRSAEAAMREEVPAEAARAVCRVCGYAARATEPVACPVCGADASAFEAVDVDALLRDAVAEGSAETTGFDGQKIGWTLEARRLLQQLPAGYLRRRVKAIVEKTARTRRLPAITVEVAEPFVRPELDALDAAAGPHRAPLGPETHTGPHVDQQHRLPWDDAAVERLERIPAGFLRNLACEQIERLALALRASQVTVLHVEAGIAEARARMSATGITAAGRGEAASSAPESLGEAAASAPEAVGVPASPAPESLGEAAASAPEAVGVPASPAPDYAGYAGTPPATESDVTTADRATLNEVTAPVVDALGRRHTGTATARR